MKNMSLIDTVNGFSPVVADDVPVSEYHSHTDLIVGENGPRLSCLNQTYCWVPPSLRYALKNGNQFSPASSPLRSAVDIITWFLRAKKSVADGQSTENISILVILVGPSLASLRVPVVQLIESRDCHVIYAHTDNRQTDTHRVFLF